VVLAWKLPKFKKLEDVKVKEIVAIPAIAQPDIPVEVVELKKTHWLHLLDGSVQFSQAYLSPNWYQGGNNSLSLVANFLWTLFFFRLRDPLLGLVDLLLLIVLTIWYMSTASRTSSGAGWLMAPYLLWLLFATHLNWYVYANN
jgi:hypothetical protein